MDDPAEQRRLGEVFETIADAYDTHRPAYPEELVESACAAAALEPGAEVLEVGCGTGQLTAALLVRGLRVSALEPGSRLAEIARRRLRHSGELSILPARLEDAELPHARFRAAFSAAAIHWVDADVGWRRLAAGLEPAGTLALIGHVGLSDPGTAEDQARLLGAIGAIAPELRGSWPRYRDLATTLAGVRERSSNISAAWSWLGGHDIARAHVAQLFGEARMAAFPLVFEHSAEELTALLATMSFWSRLPEPRREAVAQAIAGICEGLGRPLRSSVLACLLTAPRSKGA